MKLLFIENRYKTYFFDPITKFLEQEGHEIFWIVQNKKFMPEIGKQYVIKYPSDKKKFDTSVDLSEIFESDRQINFFNKRNQDYFYYYFEKIDNIIKEIKPDVVFGESTAFHELLTIKSCKNNDILYLHPSSCRYPKRRFSFYQYDTLIPFQGSEEKLGEEIANEIIEQISNRTSKPDYMKKIRRNRKKVLGDKLKIVSGYLTGEKYNTPNPLVKYGIEKQKKENILRWDGIAVQSIAKEDNAILYPLQMQPEANIDVWGRKYRDQLKLIKEIVQSIDENQILYVKPNPKSKYELSKELVAFVEAHPKIKGIHHSVSMDSIFNDIQMVITVTGTIAIECILSNKPVLTLVNTINNQARNCKFIESVESIKSIQSSDFVKLSRDEQIDFINKLNETSYKGLVSDPFSDENCIHLSNIKDVLAAFNDILRKI